MSSCSNVPDGPKPRMPASRIASLTAAGAALSAKTHAQTSVFSGPRGCQTRKVRETERSIEKFGKSVPTIGFTRLRRGPRRFSTSGADPRLVGLEFGYRRVDDHIRADPDDAVTIARPEHHSSWVGAQTVLAA